MGNDPPFVCCVPPAPPGGDSVELRSYTVEPLCSLQLRSLASMTIYKYTHHNHNNVLNNDVNKESLHFAIYTEWFSNISTEL